MLLFIVALSLALIPVVSSAQQPTRIDGAPQCSRCSIQLTRVATIGSVADEVLLSSTARLTRDSRGNYYAAPTAERGKMAVYNSAGRYLRSIGKLGQGPGEFTLFTHHVVGRGDTLHILDRQNGRYTKIPPGAGLSVATPIALPSTSPVRLLPSGEIVSFESNTRIGTRSIVVFAPDGKEKSRTGMIPPLDGLPTPTNTENVLIPDVGAVWLAPVNRYLLEKWSLDGRRLESITRSVPWFAPWTTFISASAMGKEPAPTRLFDAFTDGSGRIWTLFWAAERNFKPLGPTEPMGVAVMNILFDTYVEVIDVVRRQVIVSQHFSEPLQSVVGTDHVYSVRQNSDDIWVLDVYQLRLVDPGIR